MSNLPRNVICSMCGSSVFSSYMMSLCSVLDCPGHLPLIGVLFCMCGFILVFIP